MASDGLTGTAGAASVQKVMIIRTLANKKIKFRAPVGKKRRAKKERRGKNHFASLSEIDEKRSLSLGTGLKPRIRNESRRNQDHHINKMG